MWYRTKAFCDCIWSYVEAKQRIWNLEKWKKKIINLIDKENWELFWIMCSKLDWNLKADPGRFWRQFISDHKDENIFSFNLTERAQSWSDDILYRRLLPRHKLKRDRLFGDSRKCHFSLICLFITSGDLVISLSFLIANRRFHVYLLLISLIWY